MKTSLKYNRPVRGSIDDLLRDEIKPHAFNYEDIVYFGMSYTKPKLITTNKIYFFIICHNLLI